jgi:hypothetical protein
MSKTGRLEASEMRCKTSCDLSEGNTQRIRFGIATFAPGSAEAGTSRLDLNPLRGAV